MSLCIQLFILIPKNINDVLIINDKKTTLSVGINSDYVRVTFSFSI